MPTVLILLSAGNALMAHILRYAGLSRGADRLHALLHGRRAPVCVYARAQNQVLLASNKGDVIRFSEAFPDADVLLAECARRGLEGIVCKRKDSTYRSGPRSGWIKVKTEQWKAANRYHARLFEKG